MKLGIPESLSSLVRKRFEAANASESLIFSATELTVIRACGVPFQLRYCPALSKKPKKQQTQPSNSAAKKPDPFDNPPPSLLIASIPQHDPTHVLVLNKYPVISQHFILATKAFKQQTDLLEEDDLAIAFACLKEWEADRRPTDKPRRLFAFFNSGEHSGASQPHRHIQFLPVEEMRGGQAGQGWKLLADEILSWSKQSDPSESVQTELPQATIMPREGKVADFQVREETLANCLYLSHHSGPLSHPHLPFLHYASRIPQDATAQDLYCLYMELYEKAVASVRKYSRSHPDEGLDGYSEGPTPASASISYNMAMTTSSMVICPRRQEGAMLRLNSSNPDGEIGPIALNGTILAGTLMVKTEEEWNTLRSDELQLEDLLIAIGIPFAEGRTSNLENKI